MGLTIQKVFELFSELEFYITFFIKEVDAFAVRARCKRPIHLMMRFFSFVVCHATFSPRSTERDSQTMVAFGKLLMG